VAFLGAFLQAREARGQAQAISDVAARELVKRRRSAAAALFAELTACEAQLLSIQQSIRENGTHVSRLLLAPVDTRVFDADPTAVGLLKAADSYVVRTAYGTLHLLSQRCEELSESMEEDGIKRLPDQLERAQSIVQKALTRLRAAADIVEEPTAHLRRSK
jgi:hypothetical protein